MSHEGYHRIETAEMPRPDVNYLLTRLQGQILRVQIINDSKMARDKQLDEAITSALAFANLLREALQKDHIDVV